VKALLAIGVAVSLCFLSSALPAQSLSSSALLSWSPTSDSTFRVTYVELIDTRNDSMHIVTRHVGQWLLMPQQCDSASNAGDDCVMVIRQTADTLAVGYDSIEGAASRPGLPTSERIPVRVTGAGEWDVPRDWKTGPRDPVIAAAELGSLFPIHFPSHPVHVGEEWPVISVFDHTTPNKQFADSFSGVARLDSLTGKAGHELAWLSMHGQSVGHGQYAGSSLDTLASSVTAIWDVAGGRPVRVSNTAHGVSAVRGKDGRYRRVLLELRITASVRPDSTPPTSGAIP
jgi:hypothetical protein